MNLEKLREEMSKVGYMVESLKDDGSYNRFKVGSGKGKAGYCKILNIDAGIVAFYGDYVSGQNYTWTAGSDNGELSQEEKAKIKKHLADEAKKLQREHDKGAMAANFFWNTGDDITTHEYLKNKKVNSYGLKLCLYGAYENWLMVPGYNADGEIRTVNYIKGDGAKLFETGAEKKGTFYEIPGDDQKIIICEGYSTGATIHEATGQTVIVSFDAGNLFHVAKIIREKNTDAEIVLAADNDQYKPDVGNVGVNAATDAAIEIDARLAVPLFNDIATKPTDFNDLAALESLHAVIDQIEAAEPIDKVKALKVEADKLLELDPIEREFERDRLADKYKIRKSVIDDYLAQQSKQSLGDAVRPVVFETEPATDPVDGDILLTQISQELSQRVILPEGAADAISLWTMLTYCHEAFYVLPMIGVTSPTRRCGKSTLIGVIKAFSDKGLSVSNITPAAIFRTIEKFCPTLLIDEADRFLKDKNNNDMIGVINSGHDRNSAFVIRLVGDDHEPGTFSTWGPKVIGMIGTLPDTIEDRSIVIKLRRMAKAESVSKPEKRFFDQCAPVRAKLKRWADDNLKNICDVDVTVPPSGNHRADDNWSALFSIAQVIGGDWPDRVKLSQAKLSTVSDAEATGIKLLIDIRDIFNSHDTERMFSKTLVEALNELTESPWADWNNAKGISTNGMARLLKPFGIESKTIRIEYERFKGYELDSFQDAFKRYLPGDPNVTPCQSNDFNDLDEKANVTSYNGVTDEKDDNQLNLFTCHGVTDEKPGTGENKENNPCHGCNACDQNTMMCHSATMFEGKSEPGIPCKDAVKTCEYNKE